MPSIGLVVTDLDGTLWHADDAIDPRVVAAMTELERRGIPLLIATGRRTASTRTPLGRVGHAPPAVVLNGALGLNLANSDRFHTAPFRAGEASAAMAAFAAIGLEPVVYVDHPRYDVFLGATPSTHPGHAEDLRPQAAIDDLERVCAEEAVLGFSMIGVTAEVATAASVALDGIVETHMDQAFGYPGLASLTVAPKGQSKWDGVLAYCAAQGIDSTTVLAVADGPNDIELLTGAARRLVPAVAHPRALALADHVIPAAVDGGWTEVLDHLD